MCIRDSIHTYGAEAVDMVHFLARHLVLTLAMLAYRRARIFEKRSQSDLVPSDVTILQQPLGRRRAAVVVHRGTFTSNARKVLLRPILENGTIQTAIKNCTRNQSVRLFTSGFVSYLYIVTYSSERYVTYVTEIWIFEKSC